nr:RHS repeat-associated core domain-containing protein [Streptomyces montanus]
MEKDPTPGDPDRVRSLAKSLHDFADDVQDALRLVKGMAEEEAVLTWVGKTAEVFQDEFSGVPKNLKKLKKSYDLAGDALAAYWPKLERAQALADKALAKGREAQADLSSAKSRLTTADSWVTRATKEADKYKEDKKADKDVPKPDEDKVRAATRDAQNAESAQTSAQSDVTSAQNALDAAKKMAADARQMREDAAGEAKRKLDEASDAGIQNRKWYEEVGDWVSDNWDTIVAVCKVVVAVLGIIAMIIGGPILGAIVLIAALVVLADTLNKYAKGQASLWDVAFAALDCIPGGKGLTTLGGLARGMKGLKGLKGLKNMANGVRGLAKSGRRMLADGAKGAHSRMKSLVKGCGDPVDPATGHMYLEETDIALPGTLPLTFTRRVSSGYRAGSWFGPTWSSTIDQRLEIDECGIVFVAEDGMLLAYSHPEGPDALVFPESGPRWPLSRLDDGGYRITDPITGQSRQFAAPAQGLARLERISDRNHNTIAFEYDTDGAPSALRHSCGYHLALTVEDGFVTALRLITVGEGESNVTIKRFGYSGGNLTSATNSSGLPTQFTYDEQLRITSWEDTNLTRYEYAYDEQGRCIAQGGEAGHLANTFTYDLVDPAWPDCHVTEVTTAEGATSRLVVDDRCLIVAEIDPLGATVTTAYDAYQNVISTTDQLGHTLRIVNNELGQPIEVTDPANAVTRLVYNDLHLAADIHLPDGTHWQYAYDERGNLTAVTGPTGTTSRSTYTPAGHPSTVTDVLGHITTVRLKRNRSGRLLSETVDGRTLVHAYDEAGRRTGRTTPTGATSTWAYDAAGRTARLTASGRVIDFDRDASGREVSRRIGAHVTLAQAFDEVGRLATQAVTADDGQSIQHRAYTYRADGNLTGIDDQLSGTRRFDLDRVGRVTAVHSVDWAETYTYDAAGNQTHSNWPHTHPGHDATGSRTYTGTRITHAGRVRYEHDELGRITMRQKTRLSRKPDTWRYEWDAEDRLTAVVTPDGTRWHYTYDPLGRRTAKQRLAHDGETVIEKTIFTWDGTTLCEQTTTAQELPHPVTLTWDHHGATPVTQTERVIAAEASQDAIDSRFFAIVTDLIGTPTELIDESGEIAWRARSTLWGTTARAARSTTYTPLRFPGQYHDPESGLHYNYFRHYDPETARFTSPDPLGLAAAPNPVAYVLNPYTWSDPLGLTPCRVFAVDSAGVAQELPVAHFDEHSFPGVNDNLSEALARGESPIVERQTGRRNIRRNRRHAQRGLDRPGPEMTWEEFPFASSRQGGHGAVTTLIERAENDRQGGFLSSFYSRHGIQNGDSFYVAPEGWFRR